MANQVAYGFVGLESLFSQRIENVNVQVLLDAIQQTSDEQNRQVMEMSGDFYTPTVEYKVRFRQPGVDTMQPLDEWGNPLPIIPKGLYDVAFPIQGSGTNWGGNRVARAHMTVDDLNINMVEVIRRDADWIKRHVFAAIFDNTSWVFEDEEHGSLTIEPMANGDGVLFVKRSGLSSTDNHYIAQTAAVADGTNPFTAIYDNLREHPANGTGAIVAYIPTNIKADVEGLADFVEVTDPDIEFGANSDQVRGVIGRGFGDEVLGKVNKVWIIESGLLPDNYILCNVRGSGSASLRMREYDAASVQGLINENHSPDGNLMENRFIRYAGFGAHNRVGALVYQVEKGDTTYVIPAGFATPLAV